MKGGRRLMLEVAAVAPAALLFFAVCLAGTAAATSFQISNLRVLGGEANWHADGGFTLEWDRSPPPPAVPRAVQYRLYEADGTLVQATARIVGADRKLDIEVPAAPAAYRAELWLEDAEGNMGPAVSATLRFDDAVPSAPAPQGPPAWLAARQGAVLDIGHPPAPVPISGIRGYAVSVDTGGGSAPCALVSRCLLEEIDLPGGIDDDTVSLGVLPEGVSYARVVAVSGSGVASPVASAPIRVDASPPEVSLQGSTAGWSSGPLQLTTLASDRLSGMTATGPGGPFTAIAVDGSTPRVELGDRVSVWVAGTGEHRVTFFARDAAGNIDDGQLGSAAPVTSIVRIDEEPPAVAFAPKQDVADPERIEALVSDADSGPSPDRGVISLRPVDSAGRFQELPTQVSGDRLVAQWNSEAFAPGRYEFLATGFDHAGNAASGGSRRNGLKMVLANPLKTPVRLEAGFGDKLAGSRREVVAAGRAVVFVGRLLTAAGNAPAGLPIAVTETFAGGSNPSRRGTILRTAEDGSFSLRLPPGPSREISASFAGTRTLTRAAAASVRLGVRARVRLKVSARTARVGGAPVVFTGRVAAAGASSRAGVPIELQFRYRGAGWSEFRTVETDAKGRFRYPYRFSDDDSRGVRFGFRAFAGKKEGWPYEPAFSHPVAVSGR
ncbi:MAG TPA: hypothetical protein VFJ61_05875 [Solirubrobacterales bacterium]|nr:hypothetical protein [Solirubrobacterales bacterium]